MADMWSQREFALMHHVAAERRASVEKNLGDGQLYEIEGRGYAWKQTPDELEVHFFGRPLPRGGPVDVQIRPTTLKVAISGQTVFDDELWSAVRPDDSTWTVEQDGILRVDLQKVPLDPPDLNNWPCCGRTESDQYARSQKAVVEQRGGTQEKQKLASDQQTSVASVVARESCDTVAELKQDATKADSSDDSSNESDTGEKRKTSTTGTWAEQLRLTKAFQAKEIEEWSKGTKAAAWISQRTSTSTSSRENVPRFVPSTTISDCQGHISESCRGRI